ncbi:LysR family transcriptional regulator [Bacillus sp. FJAT-49736]|uniref:LysR family transcriptional regulator n=1 Tax=Bacillus sp. FJAT-49736 TaxID=2833582 RepID=UPI001BC9514D|nr:LysR family transcriptional regulator [Bacillus sp. FJAT-49736]MBS4172218.1 LysR family transcriptional regulator [Bacillus sp. FJAT-49736]
MVSLGQLEAFVKIVEDKSFTRAAEALHLTQPGISHTISSLENELGVTLFNRNKKGIELTDAGEALLPFAREALQQIEKMKQTSAEFLGLKKGTVKLGGFPSIMAKYVPSLIASFQRKYPNIRFSLYEGSYEKVVEMLEKGIIDIGFTVSPVPNYLKFIPLIEDKMMVVLPWNHRLAEKDHLALEEISNERFIKDLGCERYLKELYLNNSPNIDFAISDLNIILSLIHEELGITILPEMSVSNLHYNVKTIKLDPPVSRNIVICYDERRNLPLVGKVFYDFVAEWFMRES